MISPEVQQRLEEAREFRATEATALHSARGSELKPEAREHLAVLRQDPRYQEAKKYSEWVRWETMAAEIPEFSQEAWEKAGRAFSAFNNGIKAALFLEIARSTNPGTYLSIEAIAARFWDLFSGTELLEAVRKHTKGLVVSYCQESLCDVGLLTEEYNLQGELIGFGLTQDGRDFGIAAAAQVLRFENSKNQSVLPLLGATNSAGKTRSPANRTKVLDYLARHPYAVREADLSAAFELDNASVRTSLEIFHQFGLLEYKVATSRTAKEEIQFQVKLGQGLIEAPYVSRYHVMQDQLVKKVSALVSTDPQALFSISDILSGLPEEVRSSWKDRPLRSQVSRILSGLVREGKLRRVDDFEGGKKFSDITITRKGWQFVRSLVWPVLFVASGEPLTDLQKKAASGVLENLPNMARRSAELYYPYSISSKKRGHEENKLRLVEAISGSSSRLTNKDLAKILRLRSSSIMGYLKPRIKGSNEIIIEVQGQVVTIVREKINRVWYYSIKE